MADKEKIKKICKKRRGSNVSQGINHTDWRWLCSCWRQESGITWGVEFELKYKYDEDKKKKEVEFEMEWKV